MKLESSIPELWLGNTREPCVIQRCSQKHLVLRDPGTDEANPFLVGIAVWRLAQGHPSSTNQTHHGVEEVV